MSDRKPQQADGGGKPTPTPTGRKGGGESGGGAYTEQDVNTGANDVVERPVKTGRKPA